MPNHWRSEANTNI